MAMATAPSFFIDSESRNLLLVGIMLLSPFLIGYYRGFYKNELLLYPFMLSLLIFPYFNHPESMRWSTILFTFMYSLTFIAYIRLLNQKGFTIETYEKVLRLLIYAYFIVLLIQQFCVLTGLPVFNASTYRLNDPWKLNSLAIEPSYSGRTVGLLMYCYIVIKEIITNEKYLLRNNFMTDKWVWLAFIWTMLTMGSGAAFLFIVIILTKVFQGKNLIALIILTGFILIIIDLLNITEFNRTLKIFLATFTFDIDAITEADASGAYRIIPIIVLFQKVSLVTLDDWFGHGIDYVGTFLDQYIVGAPKGITGGGLLQIWMEYGFISFALITIFSIRTTWYLKDFWTIVFWFVLIFIYSINIQIFWLCIILLYTNNFFRKKYKMQPSKST
jgi:hypothetical protein